MDNLSTLTAPFISGRSRKVSHTDTARKSGRKLNKDRLRQTKLGLILNFSQELKAELMVKYKK